MLLTITYTGQPATDLGYLLHKSPPRIHSSELAFGNVRVFYPEATPERCTVALVEQYVNDRRYTASSFLSVAIARTFGTAMSGKSKERQALADTRLPFELHIAVVPCRVRRTAAAGS
jgi:hypothetical protein